jgi:hypothetical protein
VLARLGEEASVLGMPGPEWIAADPEFWPPDGQLQDGGLRSVTF